MTLLHRSTRKFRLSDAGRMYYGRARGILEEVRDLEDTLAEYRAQPWGLVRISLSHGLARTGLIPALPELRQRHPELAVELHLSDSFVDLMAHDIDIALRLGALRDSSLVAKRLASQVRVACAAPSYLEKHGVPQTPQDLLAHNCLTFSVGDSLNRWDFVGLDGLYSIPIRGDFAASDMLCLLDAGIAGLGIVRVSNLVNADAIERGALVPILVEHTPERSVPLHAVTVSKKMSPKVRATIDFLVDVFARVPDPGRPGFAFRSACA